MIEKTPGPAIRGGYAIVLTPFREDGRVDYAELEKQLGFISESRMTGVVICGSTGEFTYLSREETREMMSFSKKVVGGRKKFVCGATAANFLETERLLGFIEELGADGALVAPPYYFPLGDDDVLDFYTDIASADGELPIIAYNIPQCTSGVSLKVYKELLKLPRIKGLKNSGGNVLQIMQQIAFRNEARGDFAVLTGSDESIYPLVNSGADGSFTAIGFLYPELISAIYDNLDDQKGLRVQEIVVRLAQLAGSLPYPLGYRLLGEASGRMNFGAYLQAVSEKRMAGFLKVKDQMREILQKAEREGLL